MAVYTHLPAEQMAALIRQYDVGSLMSAKGIAEGVSNSNWIVETSGTGDGPARFILTMYERRIALDDLPFFLDLLDHLSAAGAPVPRTIHDGAGRSWRMLDGKAVALIEFLPGVSIDTPTTAQARAVGAALAEMHMAARAFPQERPDRLDVGANLTTLKKYGLDTLAGIDPALPEVITRGRRLAQNWPNNLPTSIIHSDLFPDNVLMLDDKVSGLIDFYFACNGSMAYDLAVTHAAWSFTRPGAQYDPEIGSALVEGYESVRLLSSPERSAMPILAQGACLRFVASRAEDWIDTPEDAHVQRKDPMDFVRKWDFYANMGDQAFA